MKTGSLLVLAAICSLAAQAQISNNQSLNGKYYFRQVLFLTDGTANVTGTVSGSGTLTFDGNGNFTFSGQQIVGSGGPAAISGNGTYSVQPGGFTTLTNPLLASATLNARLGQGAVVGSSTEAGTTFDLFIAIQAPPAGASNSTLSGSYWVSSLEFLTGGTANIRSTNFKLTANGSGSFAENTITGQAVNLSNQLMNQTVGPITYSVSSDSTGTITFPLANGLTSATQLISGTENIYVSNNGLFFIGGSMAAGGHGLVIGVKTFNNNATNTSWNGFYWSAGMRFDTQPARVAAVVGGVHANADGNSIWARRTRQSDGLFDAAPLLTYSLSPDGSGPWTSAQGHVDVGVTGSSFSSTGVDVTNSPSYEIYFGVPIVTQAANGQAVFLNPQGILNAASLTPPGSPVSPGGFVTLFGSGFPATPATAQIPFPTTGLGGVQVTVNGTPAPVYYVAPTQISMIVPYSVTGSTATFVVTVNNTKSNAVTVPMAATAPGIFSAAANGIGDGAIQHSADYSLVTAAHPAVVGEYVTIYLTGLGAVSPTVADGAAAPSKEPLSRVSAPLAVYIGGVPAPVVYYAGLVPGLSSLYQLNVQIPKGVPPGSQSLAVQTAQAFTDLVNIAIN